MSVNSHKPAALLGLAVLGVVVLAMSIEPFLSHKINPVALTRHAIEQCEHVQDEVLLGIRDGTLPTDLGAAFGSVLRRSTGFRDGYVKLSEGAQPKVLDAWEQPLQMMAKSNLMAVSKASVALLAKTNEVVIWSTGPNRSNEFGNGDDVIFGVPGPKR